MTNVTFKLETAHEEGSYSALVSVYGMEFSIHYVAGEIRAYGTAGQKNRKAWQVNGAARAAREAVSTRIAALGPTFEVAHQALYAE